MQIPSNMIINLDNHQNYVVNKSDIIKIINSIKRIDFLEFYVDSINAAITKSPNLNIDDVKEILEVANSQINKLKGIEKVSETFKDIKKTTTKFNNIAIIDTPKEINDKTIEGVRHDVTYIKVTINGKNQLYELSSVEKVKMFLSNKELINNMSEQELISYLTSNEVSTKINTREINTNEEPSMNSINEEIDKIYDSRVRRTFEESKNDVLKERIAINNYVNKNMPYDKVQYGLNSNGERIYTVRDKIIKFKGKDRSMLILSEDEKDLVNEASFEKYQNGDNNINTQKMKEYQETPELMRSLLYIMFNNNGLTPKQNEDVISFLDICVTNEEKNETNPPELQDIFDEYYKFAKNENIYPNERLREIFERKDKLVKDNEQIPELNNKHVLKLENKSIKDLNKNAFVVTTIILESSLVLGLIMGLIILFK